MEEEVEKLGFFKKVINSITDFEKYALFAVEKTSKSLWYLAKLIMIFSLILAGIFTYKFANNLKDVDNYIKENIEQLEYKDNLLSVNNGNEIILNNEEAIIQTVIINTNASEEQIDQYKSKLVDVESGLIILKDKILYKNQLLAEQLEYSYTDISNEYNINELTKDDLLSFLGSMQGMELYGGFIIIFFVYLFILYYLSALIDAITLGILGIIIARIVGMKIRFKSTLNMGAYALTLSIILNIVYVIINAFTGFTIQYFDWMYRTISYIYIIVAILIIKADFINRQMELMKIIEEQEKVKKELEQKEQEKEDKDKDKPKDEDKKEEKQDKKKEKNEGKDNNLGKDRTCTTKLFGK